MRSRFPRRRRPSPISILSYFPPEKVVAQWEVAHDMPKSNPESRDGGERSAGRIRAGGNWKRPSSDDQNGGMFDPVLFERTHFLRHVTREAEPIFKIFSRNFWAVPRKGWRILLFVQVFDPQSRSGRSGPLPGGEGADPHRLRTTNSLQNSHCWPSACSIASQTHRLRPAAGRFIGRRF